MRLEEKMFARNPSEVCVTGRGIMSIAGALGFCVLAFGAIAWAGDRPLVVSEHPPIQLVAWAPNGNGLLARTQGKRVLIVKGTPEEMGEAHGTLLAEEVNKLAERVLYLVGGLESIRSGIWFMQTMAEIDRRTSPFIPSHFLRECEAMSKAAGMSPLEGKYANLFPERFHCSGVAVRGKASRDGRVLHARVLDYMTDIHLQDAAVLMVFIPQGRNIWLSVSYAGFIGTVTAMNEKGLAIGEMGGGGVGDWDGMPMSFLLREIMESCGTVEEALDYFRTTPRTCEYFYVLSDRSGNLAAVHATSKALTILRPGEQHPLLPPVPEDTVFISGGEHAQHLSRRVHEHFGTIDVPTMIEIIKRPVAFDSNLHDAIFAPETLEVWFADATRTAPACDQPYAYVRLPVLVDFFEKSRPSRAESPTP